MSNLNRARLDKKPETHHCLYTNSQLDCACADCDGCQILEKVLNKVPDLNSRIEAGVRDIYNQYSPSWQHTRNQIGSKF